MKMVVRFSALLLACALSFAAGICFSGRKVITYSVQGYPVSFNRAWPTYGLPLVNYESILNLIQQGHSKESIPFLEAYLDAAVEDAECRRPLLHGEDQLELDKSLRKVASYRSSYPRPITNSTNQLDQSWIASQRNVDAFLITFSTTNHVKSALQN